MTIPAVKPTAELLISTLRAGDSQTHNSFRRALDRANLNSSRTRREEVDALDGILEGLARMAGDDAGKTLAPTLRHLLARVL